MRYAAAHGLMRESVRQTIPGQEIPINDEAPLLAAALA